MGGSVKRRLTLEILLFRCSLPPPFYVLHIPVETSGHPRYAALPPSFLSELLLRNVGGTDATCAGVGVLDGTGVCPSLHIIFLGGNANKAKLSAAEDALGGFSLSLSLLFFVFSRLFLFAFMCL